MKRPSTSFDTAGAAAPTVQRRDALHGQVALVSGGSSGIGLAIARLLAQQGARVAVFARGDDKLNALRRSRPGSAADPWLLFEGDVGRPADVERFTAAVEERFGGFDIVVSNAGFHHAAAIEDIASADWQAVFDTHLGGAFLLCRSAFSAWKRQRRSGRIVFVSSKAALAASPGASAYACAKAAQLHLARCLAEEGGPWGIRVNSVLPDGVIRGTGIFDEAQRIANALRHGIAPERLEAFYAERNALKRAIGPEDVARAVLFLCDDARSAAITGAALTVDGGLVPSYLR